MPVLVFTGGAAVKAGVQEGDRIIKVFLHILSQTLNLESYWFLPVFSVAEDPLFPLSFHLR